MQGPPTSSGSTGPAPPSPGPSAVTGADEPAALDFAWATIIVKPFRAEPVLGALETFRLRSLIVSEARGYGRQKGHLELYQGREYAISFIPKVKIEVVIARSDVEAMIGAVSRAARTGRIGDGKVFLQGGDFIDLDPE